MIAMSEPRRVEKHKRVVPNKVLIKGNNPNQSGPALIPKPFTTTMLSRLKSTNGLKETYLRRLSHWGDKMFVLESYLENIRGRDMTDENKWKYLIWDSNPDWS